MFSVMRLALKSTSRLSCTGRREEAGQHKALECHGTALQGNYGALLPPNAAGAAPYACTEPG